MEIARPGPVPIAPPPEERRLVTALFCDLVGFTPLSERLDPEDVRDIQTRYFGAMRMQVERYGGTVEKYAGDAVLALFGAPIAHEDDAERAVLCALGMQKAIEPVAQQARQRWNVEPSIRVGVNTGEVVSGVWDTGGRQDVAVTGDAVNTAARIQAAAEPGEVVVGAETMRLTRRRIRYGEERDLVLKGKLGTVPAYPALGLREEFGERWEAGPRISPLVGRDREMVQLLDAWIRAQAGEGQLVTLVGDAGVGKSRLVAEVIEKVASTSAVRVARGRCLSYGQEISLWLVADLLRSLFGVREQDTLDEVKVKVRVAVTALLAGSDADTQAEALDVLGEVLGLPPGDSVVASAGAQIRRQALIRSLRAVLRAVSERAPAMLVLEDLHWVDGASAEILKEVLSDIPGLRLLVLIAQRPGWNAPWSEWGWTERTTLRPLREEDAALLAGAVLSGMTLSTDLERYVAERAGGNPFFVEEMLRALEETGGLTQQNGQTHLAPGAADYLPSTLTEVLLARLDRLDGEVRGVAQVASVIGRSFSVRLLAHVTEREAFALEVPLTALQQAEIAFPSRGSDLEYVFKHVSMREVAYNTLVQKRRQELHLQTARAIAATYSSDEYVEIIAYHYMKTEEHTEAAQWLERAGDRAAAIYAIDIAVGHYQEAAERLRRGGADASSIARLDEKLGDVLYAGGRYDEALDVLARAEAVYRAGGDLEAAGRVTARMGMAHRQRGTPEEGIALVQPMVELLQWNGPSQALAFLHVALATLFILTGRLREELSVAERAAEIARAIGDDRLLGEAEERRGLALTDLGRPEEGRRVIEGAIPLIEAGGDLVVLFRVLINAGYASDRLGQTDQCTRYTERALEVAERIGNYDHISFALANLGSMFLTFGEWEAAREHAERAVVISQSGDRTASAAAALQSLGQLYAWKGDWETAAQYLDEALAVAHETGNRQSGEQVHTFLAELDLLEGRAAAAVARLEPLVGREDAEPMLLPMLARSYLALETPDGNARAERAATDAVNRSRDNRELQVLADALTVQGMVFTRQERWEEAGHAFEEGLQLSRAMPYPYAEARILYEYGMMHERRGNMGDARERPLHEALTIFRRLGAQKDIERTERALEHSLHP